MSIECPRCGTHSPTRAGFCRHCGLRLERTATGLAGAGRVQHPDPLPPPQGTQPVDGAPDLFFRWEADSGGSPLLGTEPLRLIAFNAGYNLELVVLQIRGLGRDGAAVFTIAREIDLWNRGDTATLDIPSWELPDPVQTIRVALVQAGFGSQD